MNSNSKAKAPTISMLKAFLHAVRGRDIKYDPSKKAPDETDLSKAITEIKKGLENLTTEHVKLHLDQAKVSYAEVKTATEYQDQKAARLLTILAFLTAAAATIFVKFIDIYTIHSSDRTFIAEIFICAIYLSFGMYFLVIAAGALTTFYATQTRFTIPEESDFKSLLFFKGILSSTPAEWGQEFSPSTTDITRKYLENYVVETYLIAIKTNVKVRYLRPAQAILQLAIKILFVVIFLLALVLLFVPRDAKKQEKNGTNETITYTHNASSSGLASPQAAAVKQSATATDAAAVVAAPIIPAQAPSTQAGTNMTSNKAPKGEKHQTGT